MKELISPIYYSEDKDESTEQDLRSLDFSACIEGSGIDVSIPKENFTGNYTEGQKPGKIMDTLFSVSSQINDENIQSNGFIVENCNLFYRNGRKNLLIGNFTISILRETQIFSEIVDADNTVLGYNTAVKWDVCVHTRDNTYTIEMANDELMNGTGIEAKTACRAFIDQNLEAKRFFKRYVSLVLQNSRWQIIREYTCAGWKRLEDGLYHYVTAEGTIGALSWNVFASQEFRLFFNHELIGQKEVFESFFRMRYVFKNKLENGIALQMFSVMSVMTTFFAEAGFPIDFILALIGTTNAKKTSTAIVFAKLFNRTNRAGADLNFTSTTGAILEAMEKYADSIVIVDDLTPQENALGDNEQKKKLELLVRGYGDRRPRMRSKTYAKQLGANAFSAVKGCCLITGEVYDGCKSSQSRTLQLTYDANDVDEANLSFHQKNLWILPTFFVDFIQYLTENQCAIIQLVEKAVPEVRNSTTKSIRTPRFRKTAGLFKAVVTVFYKYALNRHFLSNEDCEIYATRDLYFVSKVITENDRKNQTIAPGITIIVSLFEALNEGAVFCINLRQGNVSEKNMNNADVLFEDEENLYIPAEYLWKIAKKYCNAHDIYFPYYDGRSIVQLLKNEDVLISKLEGKTVRNSHKLMFNGKTFQRRFLYIRKKIALQIYENFKKY